MPARPLPPEYMKPEELARRMGKGIDWVRTELQRDSQREIPRYPFATATQDEKTGQWSYRIHRARFERWSQGLPIDSNIDYNRLSEMVAEKVIEIINAI